MQMNLPSMHGRGQAMSEFMVLLLALMPLFLMLPLMGKYQDISHATEMASRYVAFDATVHNDDIDGTAFQTDAELSAEVQRRFFSDVDAPIKTNDTAGNFGAHRNPLWTDTDDQPLIADFSTDVCVTFGLPTGGFCDGVKSASGGYGSSSYAVSPFLSPIPNLLNLHDKGIYTGAVHVKLANIPSLPPLDSINLTMTRHTSLVPIPWAAGNVSALENRAKNLLPTSLLSSVSDLLNVGIAPIEAFQISSGPQLGDMSVARDMVPSDRLCNYGDTNCPAQ